MGIKRKARGINASFSDKNVRTLGDGTTPADKDGKLLGSIRKPLGEERRTSGNHPSPSGKDGRVLGEDKKPLGPPKTPPVKPPKMHFFCPFRKVANPCVVGHWRLSANFLLTFVGKSKTEFGTTFGAWVFKYKPFVSAYLEADPKWGRTGTSHGEHNTLNYEKKGEKQVCHVRGSQRIPRGKPRKLGWDSSVRKHVQRVRRKTIPNENLRLQSGRSTDRCKKYQTTKT